MGREGSDQFENFTEAVGSTIFRCMAIEISLQTQLFANYMFTGRYRNGILV